MDRPKTVLAAVDFSPGSRRALSEAVRISKTFDRPLHVIHVIEGRVVESLADLLRKPAAEARRAALNRARQALERLVGQLEAPPDTRLHLAVGAPVAEILACVEALEPDLLVLGECGMSRLRVRADPLAATGPDGLPTRILLVDEAA